MYLNKHKRVTHKRKKDNCIKWLMMMSGLFSNLQLFPLKIKILHHCNKGNYKSDNGAYLETPM